MLDIKFIRENPDQVKKAVTDKQLVGTVDIDKLLEIDLQYLQILRKVESHRSLKNQLSDDISKVKDENARRKLIEEATEVKRELAEMEDQLKDIKAEVDSMMLWVPNPPADDVPYGEGEDDNKVVRKVGDVPQFDFTPKEHWELGQALDLIDTERGAKLGGFRGYFLKNEAALMEQAVLKYAIDFMLQQDFKLMTVPWMVKPEYFVGTAYFPWGEEDHYKTQDGMALIGTAEVSLTAYHADEILDEKDLPVKMVGISPCFRREVGSYGKDTKGVFRIHQFSKVEQVLLLPEDEELSREWHEKMLGYVETILQNLKLPYQVLLMCSGDMGAGQRKKYDVETWFPGQRKYRETHSDSYFLDFQSRRLNMRYRAKDGDIKYVYTINNTVVATPRLIAAIIENYQQADGSIKIPEILQPYIGINEIRR
ncbi:MAG TPA: serine--tRNA ligase [Patescibacteria group bacterium]|nr:serine--tRNA ligase [Patescibacteria group bacterium]